MVGGAEVMIAFRMAAFVSHLSKRSLWSVCLCQRVYVLVDELISTDLNMSSLFVFSTQTVCWASY